MSFTPVQMFAVMLVAHALADYPLQGDFLSKAKNVSAPIPGVPWYQAMIAHSVIQGGFVGMITGSVTLGLMEAWAHFFTDYTKCRNWIGFNTDQFIHVACKVIWCALYLAKGFP